MRILYVSYYFPPFNAIGAVRAGKTCKFLEAKGHEVRVITARDQPLRRDLPLEIPPEDVEYCNWLDVNKAAQLFAGGRSRVASRGYGSVASQNNLVGSVGRLYRTLLNVPDGQVGWVPFAVRAGKEVARTFRPDVILASGSPWSSLVVGHLLASATGVPWVAELRDLWADNPYSTLPPWREALDQRIERRVLSSAAGIVAVTPHSTDLLRSKYSVPAQTIFNGFDSEDFAGLTYSGGEPDQLRIVYTGMIYPGRRDPSPLFAAIRDLGGESARIKVEFYGKNTDDVLALARQVGVEKSVFVHPSISYRESLKAQATADVLLLLLWDDPRDVGVCPGKVFEYLGAGRPALVLGRPDNVGAAILRSYGSPEASTDPETIQRYLREWLSEKRAKGLVDPPSGSDRSLMSRAHQVDRLEAFLGSLVRHSSPAGPDPVLGSPQGTQC